ncbi:hypothetical protein [Nocardioides sp. MH1]|uniref:hypothetical protein n=1 Tax=Nocardioides sp. MH1 TaxID=3242490 RepID=UPI00352305C4
MTEKTDRTAREELAALLEAMLIAGIVGLFFVFPWYCFGTYFCIEDCHGPAPEEIHTYRVLVGVLVVNIVALGATRWSRRKPVIWGWPTVAIAATVGSAIFFQVPEVNWADVLRPDPPAPQNTHYVPCYSGSHDCPGG